MATHCGFCFTFKNCGFQKQLNQSSNSGPKHTGKANCGLHFSWTSQRKQKWEYMTADSNLRLPTTGFSKSCSIMLSGSRTDFGMPRNKRSCVAKGTVQMSMTNFNEEAPYIIRRGEKAYMDELDILDIVSPAANMVPINEESYNHAAFLWKKIGDIPEERRGRLFNYLRSTHIYEFWRVAGIRFKAANPIFKINDVMPPDIKSKPLVPEFWDGRITGVPQVLGWISRFQLTFFHGEDGSSYGRLMLGFISEPLAHKFSPLYFLVRRAEDVLATEEPCDLAFEFGDGQLQLTRVPLSFPKPAKHPWPFNDDMVIYVRAVGPSILTGQVWIEGKEFEKVPKQFLGELLLIRNYS